MPVDCNDPHLELSEEFFKFTLCLSNQLSGCPNQIIIMQRPSQNSGYPSMPTMPGQMPPNPGYGMPMQPGPGFPPGQVPPQNMPHNACFMPAATIRKISNTTPPRFDPSFQPK
uniref:Uncharacterized protein n=1 Tax=Bombyx mori TaxID=7091 RepID=A0A8R2ATA3_BOMMO|nr:U1 small nuclear ribonucleoprotein A [Bombyx mori]